MPVHFALRFPRLPKTVDLPPRALSSLSILVEPRPLTLMDTRHILARCLILKLGSLGRPLRTGTAPAHPAILTVPPALPVEDPARPREDCSAIPRVVFTHSGFKSTSDQLLC